MDMDSHRFHALVTHALPLTQGCPEPDADPHVADQMSLLGLDIEHWQSFSNIARALSLLAWIGLTCGCNGCDG